MPPPTATSPAETPSSAASACFSSWFSGSPYFHTSAAAACSAATAFGDGPKPFSLAPMRARNALPRVRSSASGPTKGTVAGSEAARGVRAGRAVMVWQALVVVADCIRAIPARV